MKLFENQRKSSDEFTKWCEEFLSKFQTPLDGKLFLWQLFCLLILILFSFLFELQSQHLYHFSRHVNLLSMSMIMSDLIWERIRSLEILLSNSWKRDPFTGINRGNKIRLVLKWCPEKIIFWQLLVFVQQEQTLWGPAPAITPSINKLSGKSDTGNTSGTASSTASVNSKDDKEESSQNKGKGKKKKGKRLVDNSLLGFTVQADPDRIKSGEIHHFEDWEKRR